MGGGGGGGGVNEPALPPAKYMHWYCPLLDGTISSAPHKKQSNCHHSCPTSRPPATNTKHQSQAHKPRLLGAVNCRQHRGQADKKLKKKIRN